MINPCITIPTIFDTTQYRANPLGNDIVKKPNIIGIIHSIILFVEACRSSIAGMVVIFCIKNMEIPTNIGITTGEGSGLAKSIQINRLLIGTTS